MSSEDDSDLPEYLQRLDSFLSGKSQTTLYFELEKRGWAPEDPNTVSDEDLSRSLTNLLWSLNDLHIIVENTDHLSDRELYRELLDYCDEPTVCFVGIPGAATHWSPIGSYGAEEVQIWLRYYASDEERERHAQDYPEDTIPPSELPPYPRPWLASAPPGADSEDDDEEEEE